MNFFEHLQEILKQDDRFFSIDGVFLRNATVEAAMKYDANLLKMLLSLKPPKNFLLKWTA